MVALAVVFSGLIGMMTIPSAFVFAANIDGTAGDDTLNGTDEADTINGFEGNDIIFGEGGDDTLDGGKGDDEIRGGDGIDEIKDGNSDPLTGDADYGNKVYGGSGNDNIDVGIDYTRSDFYYVYGEYGADYIEVVSNAFIRGGPDDDTIYCTALNECPINGDEGNDEIHVQLYDVGTAVYGGSGNDEIYFNGGGGTQYGDDGNDYVFVDGGGGDLKGGEGDDILEASGGSNFYNGGLGADNFKCSPGPGDVVEDYNPGEGDTVSANCETVEGTTQPIQTVLTLNTITTNVPWGKDVTVTGKLADASNNAGVGGKTITFDGTGADNIPDNVVTNTDGTFTAKGASPTTVATGWKVQAHFAGDSGYTASDSSIKTYNTVKHSVSLAVSAASSNVPWSMPTKFTATLKDNSLGGVAISGKTIHFDGTGVISAASDKTTDSSGKAIATGTSPDTVASGWTYQAHFAGDSLYSAKDSSVKSYSTTKHSVTLSLSVPTDAVSEGASYKVSGTLTDSTAKKQLASKTITFTADDPITIGDKTTNTNGFYSATQTAPSTAGSYDIQSHFAGDSLYKARDSAVKTLTVTAAATTAP
jgi:hypothetical protein